MFGEIYHLFGQGRSGLQVFICDLSSLDELVVFKRITSAIDLPWRSPPPP
jgi:hypothetical protein